MKPDSTGISAVNYGCHDCSAIGGHSRNGVGVAAQHAEKTGHNTWAEQVVLMSWNTLQEDNDD